MKEYIFNKNKYTLRECVLNILLELKYNILKENHILNEAEYQGKKVTLNKPFRLQGETKKFAVYVKKTNGDIKKVRFGDPNMKVRNNDPKRAKSFKARHKCSEKKDKTTPGYWACKTNYKSLGNSSSKSW